MRVDDDHGIRDRVQDRLDMGLPGGGVPGALQRLKPTRSEPLAKP